MGQKNKIIKMESYNIILGSNLQNQQNQQNNTINSNKEKVKFE